MSTKSETISAPLQASAAMFDFKSAIEHGKRQVVQGEFSGVPYFVIPDNMKIETLKELVQEQLPRPYQLKQSIELLTQESFIEYFNRYATDSSTVFVNDQTATFIAVLDYHDSPGEPAWKRHVATYRCPKTKEWSNWFESNNRHMEQEDFALFIEDNIKEIIEPNGVEMLEIASSLKASNNVDFKSAIRLDNGQVQFNYTENINGQAGISGQLAIPEKIKLIIAPFLKGAAYEIEARFRYRIASGGLKMWYTLIRPHAYTDDAFTDLVSSVQSGINGRHLVHATTPL